VPEHTSGFPERYNLSSFVKPLNASFWIPLMALSCKSNSFSFDMPVNTPFLISVMRLLYKVLQANAFHPKQQKRPTSSKCKTKNTVCEVQRQQSGHPEGFRQAPNKQRQPHCLDTVINTTGHYMYTDIVSASICAGDCRYNISFHSQPFHL